MTPRTSVTERQKRLGAEVRKMRTTAGISAEFAAGLLGVDRAKISNIETGIRTINAERLRTLACNCDCTDAAYVDALVEMALPGARGWWERYRGSLPQGMLDIAELEAHSSHLRSVHPMLLPGLLQTSDHALAVFRLAIPELPESEVALRLAHRMERQQILDGPNAPACTVFVHEAALRLDYGGPNVMRAQLHHLVEKSQQANVSVRVIPFKAGGFPGAMQTVLYADGPVPELDTVQVDSAHGPEFLHAGAQLTKYRSLMEFLARIALPPPESRDFIHTVTQQL